MPFRYDVLFAFIVCLYLAGCAAQAAEIPGLVKDKPTSGFFVETKQGFMVPYTAKVPGSDATFEMVPITGGKFKIGSPTTEAGHKADEAPQVEIEVAPFWMGKHEVTWSEYMAYMEMYALFKSLIEKGDRPKVEANGVDVVSAPSTLYDPSFTFSKGDQPRQPALSMSQFAAKHYTKWLSKLSTQFYRLPSEAEWEYAARAGTSTAYSFGDDASQLKDYAWFSENTEGKTSNVGLKKPNPWGLHDMHGNVAEWVLDSYAADHYAKLGAKSPASQAIRWASADVKPKLFPRVVRGGSYDDTAANCRSAARKISHDDDWREEDPNTPQSPWWFTSSYGLCVGFRLVRPLEVPDVKEQAKYWDPDVEQLIYDFNYRIDEEGRGARGIPNDQLLEDLKKYREENK
jgi:formylglycine-generating enzyme